MDTGQSCGAQKAKCNNSARFTRQYVRPIAIVEFMVRIDGRNALGIAAAWPWFHQAPAAQLSIAQPRRCKTLILDTKNLPRHMLFTCPWGPGKCRSINVLRNGTQWMNLQERAAAVMYIIRRRGDRSSGCRGIHLATWELDAQPGFSSALTSWCALNSTSFAKTLQQLLGMSLRKWFHGKSQRKGVKVLGGTSCGSLLCYRWLAVPRFRGGESFPFCR